MTAQLQALRDRIRSSLFIVPMLFVLAGVGLGQVMLLADEHVDGIPDRLTATVDSARSVLTTVAGATLTFAGIAFSVSLLLISLASSQFSPRVVHGLFRDPFNTRVMGVVLGTFTYCLTVMRAVRAPLDDNSAPVVPSLSIVLAVVLGVGSLLAIVAFINHAAHSMDVSKILHRVTRDSIRQVRETWPEPDREGDPTDEDARAGEGGFEISFDREGWVQHVDHETLLEGLPAGSQLQLHTTAGRFAIPGTRAATMWPVPADGSAARARVLAAIMIGETRTMQQDVLYGVRQLADVGLKALSPGINDPTTAQDAMFHLGAVVGEMLSRQPPARRRTGEEGRVLLLSEAVGHAELIDFGFDEMRLAGAGQPTVAIYLLEVLHLLLTSLASTNPAADSALRRQAALVVEANELASLPAYDHERVREAYRNRFSESLT